MQRQPAPAAAHGICREILAEIRHPSPEAEPDQVSLDHVFIPGPSSGIRQVHDAAIVLSEIEKIVGSVRTTDEVSMFRRFLKEHAALHQIRVDIAHPGGVPILRDHLIQAGIALPVPAPVPLQAGAEGGDPLAFPVLDPDGGNVDAGVPAFLFQSGCPFGAALYPEPESAHGPVRQGRLAPQKGGELFQKSRKGVFAAED